MSTAHDYPVFDSTPSLSASMEDFESRDISPNLSRTLSRSHLQFRSPVASEYSDVTDAHVQGSWSPPAWRKAGSGWFKHHDGLASPMRSREGSPQKDDECHDVDGDDEDMTAAAEIPLPRSPSKGRSLSRSLSPERVSRGPEPQSGTVTNTDTTPSRHQSEQPPREGNKNCEFGPVIQELQACLSAY